MEVPSNLAFCTVNDVVAQLNYDKAATIAIDAGEQALVDDLDTNFRAEIKKFILETSAKMVSLKHRWFVPVQATVTIYRNDPAWKWAVRAGDPVFLLEALEYGDLLTITSVTLDGELIDSANYRRYSYGGTANNQAILFDGGSVSIPTSTAFDCSIVIVGTWGYHRSPSAMWSQVAGTLQAGINDTVTSFVATAGTVANFKTYGYIKIDSEVLFVTDVLSTTPYTITVQRGALGTTAASHLSAASIYNFVPMEDVVKACKSHVIRKLANMPEYNKVTVIGDSLVNLGSGMEIELNIPAREYWGAV